MSGTHRTLRKGVVSGRMLLTLVLLSVLFAGTCSASLPLYDEEDGTIAEAGTQLTNGQSYPVNDGSYDRVQTTDQDRKENMKKLIMLALMNMAKDSRGRKPFESDSESTGDDGSMDAAAEEQVQQKRGRWQGFCFRKSRSGRIRPYICWKGSNI